MVMFYHVRFLTHSSSNTLELGPEEKQISGQSFHLPQSSDTDFRCVFSSEPLRSICRSYWWCFKWTWLDAHWHHVYAFLQYHIAHTPTRDAVHYHTTTHTSLCTILEVC